jgi:hypothetical protein
MNLDEDTVYNNTAVLNEISKFIVDSLFICSRPNIQ